ncbi:ribosome maturation factor RimM [Spiroplasma eriocheiris]|uniref:Ribosome maturation factor RimM n=1 Tax=Spiroplasma eriocheiris TaxID=315358 RepID=A0A0H3XN59_9MOLU|nr:ribosome maturation factor RimM [Spiroplasma eriocheiris]AHF58160.1 16S rRNA processing protein [Spiroplasma eriocheiris CCTCC M 207170]AKM54597.1 16S rRNA-processing protein RimM [Spiroplasma eriocheiris]
MNELIKVFKINKPHAIKGEVKATMLILLGDLEMLVNKVFFFEQQGVYQPLTIKNLKKTNSQYIIKFKEFSSINEVIQLRGTVLYLPEKELPTGLLTIIEDLVDYKVMHNDHEIGILKNTFTTKAHTIFEVFLHHNNQIMLIPYVDEYVKKIDQKNKIIILDKVI